MRWVSYLSPSGGGRRTGIVEDGCVYGYPGPESPAELVGLADDATDTARRRALADPLEIIVEFEARLCAPVQPAVPVEVRLPDGDRDLVLPALVRGPDDGVTAPDGAALRAAVGVAVLTGAAGAVVARTMACLWRAPQGQVMALTVGPALVTTAEAPDGPFVVTASTEEGEVAALCAGDAGDAGDGLAVELAAETPPVPEGEELFLDGGALGTVEMRVGYRA